MPDPLEVLAADASRSFMMYLDTVNTVSKGHQSDVALPLIHLALSQVALEGARLAAIEDIEAPDAGEVDETPAGYAELAARLAVVFEGLDEYTDVINPLVDPGLRPGRLSDDLAEIAAELGAGLHHFADGNSAAALATWQRAYGEGWGPRVASAARAMQVLVAATRAVQSGSGADDPADDDDRATGDEDGAKDASAPDSGDPDPTND